MSLLQSSFPSVFPELTTEFEKGDFSPQNGWEQRKRFGPLEMGSLSWIKGVVRVFIISVKT